MKHNMKMTGTAKLTLLVGAALVGYLLWSKMFGTVANKSNAPASGAAAAANVNNDTLITTGGGSQSVAAGYNSLPTSAPALTVEQPEPYDIFTGNYTAI